ncbi:MAG TPA: DUF89 family protein [Calditrichaeota bacterium]|nr:DUF89 family protein [Calditrichota bacterium]
MEIALECVPCIVNNFLELLNQSTISYERKERAMRRLLDFMSQVDYRQSPPALGREIHKIIRKELNNSDPYREIKIKYNKLMLEMYPKLEERVQNSTERFEIAMRLAIAGNAIDFGSQHHLNVMDTVNQVMDAKFAVNDSQKLKEDLKSAKVLLYIGDNCGEIVLDKLFIKTINVSNTYFAVRGGAVINDVTAEDAEMVGMDEVATIVTTGDNAPGAVWETTSDEFKKIFHEADVIISKGQGNLEGLIDITGNIYFLFISKCDLIAKRVGAQKGDFIVKHNSA